MPSRSHHQATTSGPVHRHLTRGLARIGAAALLLTTLGALPLAVVSMLGVPRRDELGEVFRAGRLDDRAVVQIGTLLFLVLWAWFAATAVGEVARVAAWRSRPMASALEPLASSPAGWVRRLVRVALVSSTAVVGSGVLSVIGAASGGRVQAAPVTAVSALTERVHAVRRADTVTSTGRDTPYSVAVRLGDPTLRDRIIALNHGWTSAAGTVWTGGVFPEGMPITVPAGSLPRGESRWSTYTVAKGESVYRIAAALAAEHGGRVREIADEIIGRNLGRMMNDGTLFDDPSLIKIGWTIDVPAPLAPAGPERPVDGLNEVEVHTVVRGESYWSIAEDHLLGTGRAATGPEVAALTELMIATNDPLLGHDPDTLILPGERLLFPPIEVAAPAPPEPAPAPTADPATSVVPAAEPVTKPVTEPVTEPADVAPVTQTPPADAAIPPPPPAPAPAPVTVPVIVGSPRSAPVTTSLGALVLLCAGALGLVESRRRHQLRRAPAGSVHIAPAGRDIATERLLRTLPAAQRALRLDLALRSAGHHLAASGGHVRALTMTGRGTITLMLDRAVASPAAAPWTPEWTDASRWILDGAVGTDELIGAARLAGQPCPALAHLGTVIEADGIEPETSLFVDLEAFGLISIDSSGSSAAAHDVVRAIAASLAASPVGETLRLVTHDLELETHLGNPHAESAETIDAAIDCAAATLGSTPTAIAGSRTFALRARGIGGEAWEPVIIASGAPVHETGSLDDLIAISRGGGRGIAAVLIGPVEGAGMTLRADDDRWTVDPLDLQIIPVGLPAAQLSAVHDLTEAANRPLSLPPEPRTATDPVTRVEFVEMPWQLVVRVFGQVDVTDRAGRSVVFDRGKALELAAWLSLHRERPTRAAARTALWDLQVRDATFANVVSDARRALARAVPPAAGEEWIERTLTEHLPLHQMVTCDADLLRARLEASRNLPAPDAIALLHPGVDWVGGLPFAGTGYLWPDAEGITSALTLLATTATTELARHCLSIGDIDGVFWATGRGLQVLSGHEELIGLRMRAHAQRGDLAGVRGEWEGYERAINADPWSCGEPSPKLVALRRELLSH